MAVVFISLGSNLGEREINIEKAFQALSGHPGIILVKHSGNYETDPEGYSNQPKFLNAAAELETDLSPRDLLKVLQKIENKLGRVKNFKWGPRVIDLDILTYDNIVIKEEGLEIPHPLMTQREFVLKPLKEIAPEFVTEILKGKK